MTKKKDGSVGPSTSERPAFSCGLQLFRIEDAIRLRKCHARPGARLEDLADDLIDLIAAANGGGWKVQQLLAAAETKLADRADPRNPGGLTSGR